MSFRGVSKCWRLAFSDCAASTEFMSPKRPELPWFLVLSKMSEEKLRDYGVDWEPELIYHRPILHTTGKMGNISDWSYENGCKYATHSAPELRGTRILLSRLGWLLLFRCDEGNNDSSSELYFFNPFSKAKIVLPFMDVSKLICPVFDISAPPTSPDCMILVASSHEEGEGEEEEEEEEEDEDELDKFDDDWRYIKIDMLCKRGDFSWTCCFESKHRDSVIVNSFFLNGIWYLLDSDGEISAFDVANRSLRRRLEEGVRGDGTKLEDSSYDKTNRSRVSYIVKRGEQVFLRIHGFDHRYEFALPKYLPPESHHLAVTKMDYYSCCSRACLEQAEHCELLFRVNLKEAFIKESIDHSFNMDAWCAINVGPSNHIFPRWHRFTSFCMYGHRLPGTISHCSVRRGCCSQFLMWLEPIWVEPSPNLTWN
ncbi:hypothetical protein COLO4_09720 [Corchorus olitorius]|uniref:KIB1-4 beta-propeller domain-containing protein n=1 Tax=Corchorus olitorius TaxID=93759 RepID=A0A1R3KBC8_9ROSI|nr:hypothetical protein COLO4_09720 [Corchorus olitorius]